MADHSMREPQGNHPRPHAAPIFGWLPWVLLLLACVLLLRSDRDAGEPAGDRPEVGQRPLLWDSPPVGDPESPTTDRSKQDNSLRHTQFVTNPPVSVRKPQLREKLDAHEQATIELFQRCSGSVVYIQTSAVVSSRFSRGVTEVPQGTGSGFVWDDRGHIVTNLHVIESADTAQVVFADQTSFPAKLVGYEASKDVAVLKIDAPREVLQPIPIGTSADLQVGQSVFAIGNPFGFDHTLTTGIISGLGRMIRANNQHKIEDVIQTDAAINPGNSGGPLLDSDGRLIGMNTAIYSPSGAYAGIGFAIPVDTIARIVPQLIEFGKVVRPRLGIESLETVKAMAIGLRGVLIVRVQPGSAAERAGLKPTVESKDGVQLGDIIVAIDEKKVDNLGDLLDVLDHRKVGDRVKLKVVRGAETRNAKELTIDIELTDTNLTAT